MDEPEIAGYGDAYVQANAELRSHTFTAEDAERARLENCFACFLRALRGESQSLD